MFEEVGEFSYFGAVVCEGCPFLFLSLSCVWWTFCCPKIRKLTNLFKHTNINTAFKNTNTIRQYTKPKTIEKNRITTEAEFTHSLVIHVKCHT